MRYLNFRWYVPGLISLNLLFPLCYAWMASEGVFKKMVMVRLFCLEKPDPKLSPYLFDPPNRTNIPLFWGGDPTGDMRTSDRLERAARLLAETRDTVRGIAASFTPKARYNAFVGVLNTALKYGLEHYYAPETNQLFLYKAPPLDTAGRIRVMLWECVVEDEQQILEREKREQAAYARAQRFWQLRLIRPLAFSWLVFFSIAYLVRRYLRRTRQSRF